MFYFDRDMFKILMVVKNSGGATGGLAGAEPPLNENPGATSSKKHNFLCDFLVKRR